MKGVISYGDLKIGRFLTYCITQNSGTDQHYFYSIDMVYDMRLPSVKLSKKNTKLLNELELSKD